jgi:hypothetical protein
MYMHGNNSDRSFRCWLIETITETEVMSIQRYDMGSNWDKTSNYKINYLYFLSGGGSIKLI